MQGYSVKYFARMYSRLPLIIAAIVHRRGPQRVALFRDLKSLWMSGRFTWSTGFSTFCAFILTESTHSRLVDLVEDLELLCKFSFRVMTGYTQPTAYPALLYLAGLTGVRNSMRCVNATPDLLGSTRAVGT
jgi:hypothetical protein